MNIYEQWRRFIHSHTLVVITAAAGVLVVGLLIFHAGVAYGERQAFSRMGYPPAGGFGLLPHSFIPRGHGAVGTVTAVTLPTFVMLTREGESETVSIDGNTAIRNAADMPLTPADIHAQEAVIVIGDPVESADASSTRDDDSISAHIIRLLPPPQQ